MKPKIIKQHENHLFNRKEVVLEMESSVSPKNADVLKIVAEEFSVPEENVKISGIHGKFGTHIFNVHANVYKSHKDKDETEIKTQKTREAERKALEEAMKASKESKSKGEAE